MICVVLAEAMETQSEPEKEPKPRRRRRKRRATKSKKEEEHETEWTEEQPEDEQSEEAQPEYPVECLDDAAGQSEKAKSKKEGEQPEEEQPEYPVERLDEAAGQSEKPKSQSERSAERLDELKALMDQNRAKKTDNTHNGIGWCWAELLLHRLNSEDEGLKPKDPGHWTWGRCVHCETRTNRIIH